jgi:hypothetical protein
VLAAATGWASTTGMEGAEMGKGCLLWAVGVPLPIILLLYFFNVL